MEKYFSIILPHVRLAVGIISLCFSLGSCAAQNETTQERQVGGPCEGCEALLEYEDTHLDAVDTLPQFEQTEPKLKVIGTVYKQDGQTPAPDVILYIYHTNREGLYQAAENSTGWGRRHGALRGWVKTDARGQYTLYTFRPGAYPNRSEPAHIHFTVKEPTTIPYYIESVHFDDDPILTEDQRSKLRSRGGSGITSPSSEDGMIVVRRDIILGMNIPDY